MYQLLTLGTSQDSSFSLVERLSCSPFDDLLEVDLNANRCYVLYHVDGKYYVPLHDSTFHDLYRYSLKHIVHPDDRESFAALMEPETLYDRLQKADFPGLLYGQFRFRLESGLWRYTELDIAGGVQHGMEQGIIQLYLFDVQNQVDRQSGAKVSASYAHDPRQDNRTGLIRERTFFSLAQTMIDRSSCQNWCFFVLDIQQFKLLNEWYGRDNGDLLLGHIGAALATLEAECGGLAGYLGQDDFCMLLPYDRQRIQRLYDDILAQMLSLGPSVCFAPSIGICMLGDRTEDVMDLLDRASLASAAAKSDFKQRIRLYHPSMHAQTEREYHILTDFQRGLQNGEVFFVLQPQCDLSTGQVVGAESLARWRGTDGQMILPNVFIPVLEKHGFITDLDQFIWEQVCRWQRNWIDRGNLPLPVSVNVSQADFFTIDVASCMERLLEQYQLTPDMLKIEITESAYVDDSSVVANTVTRLRDRGFMVLMDDFGSGYSSLNMLGSLNVDVIKLDAQFLRLNQDNQSKGIRIIESIINMTQNMGLPVIAEGVETKRQADFLANLGCQYTQGYYFYRPMDVSEFESLVSQPGKAEAGGFHFRARSSFRIREFMDQNVYSDSMLNNILGAFAFYEWHGEDVDIVRFNQRFRELVDDPNMDDRLDSIQQFCPKESQQMLYSALEDAVNHPDQGATALIQTYRSEGPLASLLFRFYYLGSNGDTKRFYGTAQDVSRFLPLPQ